MDSGIGVIFHRKLTFGRLGRLDLALNSLGQVLDEPSFAVAFSCGGSAGEGVHDQALTAKASDTVLTHHLCNLQLVGVDCRDHVAFVELVSDGQACARLGEARQKRVASGVFQIVKV